MTNLLHDFDDPIPTPHQEVISSAKAIRELRRKIDIEYRYLENNIEKYFQSEFEKELIKLTSKKGIDKYTQTSS